MRYKYPNTFPPSLDELDMDELMSKLSDLMLSSGFDNPWGNPSDNEDRTMQALHDAILEALFSGGVLPPDMLEKLFGDPADGDQEQMRQQLEELIQQIIERMKESGYITPSPDLETERQRRAQGGGMGDAQRACHVRGDRQGARFSRLQGACATCSARSATAAPAVTTRATWPPASKPAARPSATSSATR